MNESLRKAYLNAMGVDVYYPRANLPGAKLSPAYEFDLKQSNDSPASEIKLVPAPALIKDSVEGPVREAAKETVRENVESIRNAVSAGESQSEVLPRHSSPESMAAESGASEHAVAASSSLRFALRYYRINDALAVIDEYPLQQNSSSDKECLHLLKNILRALGINSEMPEYTAEKFNWPLVEGLTQDSDEATAAKQALLGFIKGRQQQDGFKNILVFAGLIDDLLLGTAENQDRRDYRNGDADFFITLTHSLQSMLSYPQLKKDVWQQLQTLLARIRSDK